MFASLSRLGFRSATLVRSEGYRPAVGAGAARAQLRRGAGAQFDPQVVEVLLAALVEEQPSVEGSRSLRAARAPAR